MTPPKSIGGFAMWGALVDLAVFVGSFVFFWGAHGPTGPMFVLGVLNAPVRTVAERMWPAEVSTDAIDAVMMFVVVLVNGAAYGFLVGVAIAVWRRIRGRSNESPARSR